MNTTNFIQHLTNWVRGEIFEAAIFGSFGLLTIIISFLFWKFGETPNAKAVIIPLAVVGTFFFLTAVSVISSNKKRLVQYTQAYYNDPAAFVKSEKKRVEDFQYLYTVTIIVASVCFAISICVFLSTNNQLLKAIGLALIIFGLTGLVIDYFSKERAEDYYKAITKKIDRL
jgi:lipoprotein signal peptidase